MWAIFVEECWLFAVFVCLISVAGIIDIAIGGPAIRKAAKAEADARAVADRNAA
jgi:hypothetical protein